jgi:H+/Cl- antiporter ClcA
VLIGAATGGAVIAFKLSIGFIEHVFFNQLADLLPKPSLYYWPLMLPPVLGSLAVGVLTFLRPQLRRGVDYLAQSIDNTSLPWSPLDQLARTSAAISTLGSGCSLGPEGPAVELGGTMARIMGFKGFTSVERRHLFLAGTAAGVAAGFNAPIAGVFFALEVAQRLLPTRLALEASDPKAPRTDVAAVVLSAVIASIVARAGLKESMALTPAQYSLHSPFIELPLYLGLGLVCGIIVVGFSLLRKTFQGLFEGDQALPFLKVLPVHARPLLGGLLCGFVAVFFPQTLFFGYETLDRILAAKNDAEPYTLILLFQLLGLKVALTSFSLASGLVGGMFAPSLFFGAAAGAAYQKVMSVIIYGLVDRLSAVGSDTTQAILHQFFVIAGAPAYATVGAAATLAAMFRQVTC